MNTIRQIDFWGQSVLGCLMVLTIPVFLFFGFLFGLAILGCWQLLSAVFNTGAFIRTGYKKKVIRYWKGTGIILSVLLLCIIFSAFSDNGDDIQVLGYIMLFASAVLAIYYLSIYHDLILHLRLRKELSGLTKS